MIPSNPSNSINPMTRSTSFLALIALSGFIFAYFPVWKDLIGAWSNSPDSSHGFFIIPLFAYFSWRKIRVLSEADHKEAIQKPFHSVTPVEAGVHDNSETANCSRASVRDNPSANYTATPGAEFFNSSKPSNWGLVIIIFSLLLYLFAHYAEIITLRSLSMIPLVTGIVIYFFGFAVFKELIFPISLLLFMIPIPSQIYSQLTIPLQLFVSKVSVSVAALMGVPVFREGNVIHLSDRTLQVVRACSGFRSMISLLALSAAFAFIIERSKVEKVMVFLSAVPIAILLNVARLMSTAVLSQAYGPEVACGFLHEISGILTFIFAVVLFCVAHRAITGKKYT